VRGITGTLAVLLAVGYVLSQAGLPAVSSSGSVSVVHEDGWRRTAQGWEQVSGWRLPAMEPVTRTGHFSVHPATIAVLQLLVSLLLLRLDRSPYRTKAGVRPPSVDARPPNSRCPEGA
jgi:hypothetical protein